jgi:hypothetical protein
MALTLVRDLRVDYYHSANFRGVIQIILTSKSLFSGIGSYPLEGGYI